MIRKIVLTLDARSEASARTAYDVAGTLSRACDAELVVVTTRPVISARHAFDPDACGTAQGQGAADDTATGATPATATSTGTAPTRAPGTRSVVVEGDGGVRQAVGVERPDLVLSHEDGALARWLLRHGTRQARGGAAVLAVRVGGADPVPATEARGLTRLRALVTAFYRDRLAWAALAVTAVFLVYVGGAAMFWVHADYLGEPGPQIRPILHYALDSTAGFVGLTPPLFVILPFAVWAGRRVGGGVRPWRYALAGGSVFGLVTAGGPFAHDSLVARGTWIARHVTQLVGTAGAPAGPGTDVPLAESILAQLVAGLPVYILLMWLSLHVVRALTRVRHARLTAAQERTA